MFNRKTDEPGQGTTRTPTPVGTVETPRPAVVTRPEPQRRIHEVAAAPTEQQQRPRQSTPGENKKLTVGPDISLHGHISSCDRLVVEGTVEAELTDCHTIEIAGSGVFTGAAEIESAEISGRYEGALTVRGHLLIHGTGSVSGTVRYGRLEIQPGGVINGDVKTLQDVKAMQAVKRPVPQAEHAADKGQSAEAKPAAGMREAS